MPADLPYPPVVVKTPSYAPPDLDAIEQRLPEGASRVWADGNVVSVEFNKQMTDGDAMNVAASMANAWALLAYARDIGALLVNIEAASDDCPVCERAAQADGSHTPDCELARLIGAKR